MCVFSLTGKPVLENLLPWKVARSAVVYSFQTRTLISFCQTQISAGMIPRAVEQVFRGTEQMKAKGWEYKMEGQFLEIVGNPRVSRNNDILIDSFSTTKLSTTSSAKEKLTRRNTKLNMTPKPVRPVSQTLSSFH